ncbi:MAG: RNA methyltransferase [Proteobacteria bacterium]|nr:RNA methyltransferase [Pseudomonadota bacterium]
MAGTDSTKPFEPSPGPAVILVEPQLGENIGMAARAMLNCGLTELRLVSPRDGWPNEDALSASAGADGVVTNAKVFDTTADAVADLHLVFAATARPRDMTNRIVTPTQAAGEILSFMEDGGAAGILFGREAKGLKNDDIALSDAIIMVPVNPAFSSLNLAQAVFAIGHEWFKAGLSGEDAMGQNGVGGDLAMPKSTRPADKAELEGLFGHLEDELDASGFLHVAEKRPVMVRNIRNMLQRAGLTEQEVRSFRGIISSLVTKRRQ